MDKYSYSGPDSDQLISLMKERRLFLKEIINNTQKWLKAHSQKQPLCIKQRKGRRYITLHRKTESKNIFARTNSKLPYNLHKVPMIQNYLNVLKKNCRALRPF